MRDGIPTFEDVFGQVASELAVVTGMMICYRDAIAVSDSETREEDYENADMSAEFLWSVLTQAVGEDEAKRILIEKCNPIIRQMNDEMDGFTPERIVDTVEEMLRKFREGQGEPT